MAKTTVSLAKCSQSLNISIQIFWHLQDLSISNTGIFYLSTVTQSHTLLLWLQTSVSSDIPGEMFVISLQEKSLPCVSTSLCYTGSSSGLCTPTPGSGFHQRTTERTNSWPSSIDTCRCSVRIPWNSFEFHDNVKMRMRIGLLHFNFHCDTKSAW